MKLLNIKIVFLALVFSAGSPLLADETLHTQNCTWCHGNPSAQGFWIAPRLAGQRQQYIEKELFSFSNHTRDNPSSKQYMWGAVANLSPQMVIDLANYFSTLSPRAADNGDKAFVTMGKTIYEQGIPASNIVSCFVCHGPNAEGVGEIPRLGGLSYTYLKKRLEEWGKGYDITAEPMPQVAKELNPVEIEEIASYLSSVK
jgi:cytochrome c553